MSNLFDDLQQTVFTTVAKAFGYAAKWTPANSVEEKTAIVLYKDATEKHGLSDVDFNIARYVMEYMQGDFEGLKEAVATGNTTERVTIETTTGVFLEFVVRRTETKYDGKTIIAFLTPAE